MVWSDLDGKRHGMIDIYQKNKRKTRSQSGPRRERKMTRVVARAVQQVGKRRDRPARSYAKL